MYKHGTNSGGSVLRAFPEEAHAFYRHDLTCISVCQRNDAGLALTQNYYRNVLRFLSFL